jgi:sugar phosphate isomerase/epimerase
MRVGIDQYGLYPLELKPLEIMEWAVQHNADGVHFSGFADQFSDAFDSEYLKDIAQFASDHNLYIEWGGGQHIPYDTKTWNDKEIQSHNRKVAEQAVTLGTRIIRSCSGGLMRWESKPPPTEILLEKMAVSLRSQRDMLRDLGVILAIETHFEFTSFELLRLFDQCETEPGDFLGICLDTHNLLTMLEDPVYATKRLLPWIVSTHVKDGCIILNRDGFNTFPTSIGKGIVDLSTIIQAIKSLDHDVYLSVEDHGGNISIPIFNSHFLSKFPDLTVEEFARLLESSQKAHTLISDNQLQPTPRSEWPSVCEERMIQNLQALRSLAREQHV